MRNAIEKGEEGSSPLARGLLPRRAPESEDHGIIPARAGFTQPAGDGGEALEDHPRSRGVYALRIPHRDPAEGSSPLARGLRQGDGGRPQSGRIIPARAGFTSARDGRDGTVSDHPRSRGVYDGGWRFASRRGGSSPLARGLRDMVARTGDKDRIIPARAGFTSAVAVAGAEESDHPRSRGVYRAFLDAGGLSSGSSPLARGLPAAVGESLCGGRIIPARAGFTVCDVAGLALAEDHPRSRGVYHSNRPPFGSPVGSSPLARGLPAVSYRPGTAA